MSKLKRMLAYKGLTQEQKELIGSIRESFADEVKTGSIKKTGFSASGLFFSHGKCPRYWSLLFKGVDDSHSEWPYYNLRAVESGSAAHESLQDRIKKQFEDDPDVIIEDEFFREDPKMHGFIDVYFKRLNIPMEAKTCNDRSFGYRKESFKGADYHELQLGMYMLQKKAEIGLLFYENRDSFENIIIPVFMTDEFRANLERIFDWMREIEKAKHEDKLIKMFPGKRVNSKICQKCPINKACHAADEGTVTVPLQDKFGEE